MKRMKKLAMLALLVVMTGWIFADSYSDNGYLRKSRELMALSTTAFDSGDYDSAAAYARQARDWALRSDAYIAKAMEDARLAEARAKAEALLAAAKAEAEKAIGAAAARLDWARGMGAEGSFPKEYGEASIALGGARTAFSGADYPEAKRLAEDCVAALAGVSEFSPWPATYKVRLIPGRSDCLWRIAEYPFIYNDPLKWPVIYEANRKTFRDPGNPNLIFPGQALAIPEVAGETRKGIFDPSKAYAPFPKARK